MTTHRLRNRLIELRFRTLQRLDHVDRSAKTAAMITAVLGVAIVAAYVMA